MRSTWRMRLAAWRPGALAVGVTILAAAAVGGGIAVPGTTGCTTHACDTLSTDFYGGRALDANTYETSDWDEDWISFPGLVTVHVHIPPEVARTRAPFSVDMNVGTGPSPNGGPAFQGGQAWSNAAGELGVAFFLDSTGFFVSNATCATYFVRFVAHFPTAGVTLFGGRGANGDGSTAPLNDTWTWDGIQWVGQGSEPSGADAGPTAGPVPRERATLARTAYSKLLFGGFDDVHQTYLFDTWTWDGASWTQVYFPSPFPSARADAAAAVLDGALVLFGGEGPGETDLGDTWIGNVGVPPGGDAAPPGNSWTEVALPDAGTTPPARSGAAAATFGNSVVLFGGRSNGTPLGDTWIWNGTTWTPGPIAGPPPRFHAAIASLASGEVLLFGGDGGGVELGDTWLWDGTTWTVQSVPGPSARSEAAAAPIGAAVILFGGTQGTTLLDDAWTWEAGTWTQQFAGGPSPRAGAAAAGP
jgi:hypothetical protein